MLTFLHGGLIGLAAGALAYRWTMALGDKRRAAPARESEERFRQLAEYIQEVFWLSSPDGATMMYVSPAYERVWGQSCSSLLANPNSWLERVHEADRARVALERKERASSGLYDTEYRVLQPDGTVRWIRDRAFPIKNAAGEVYRVAGIAEDITFRKDSEERVQKEHSRLLYAQRIGQVGSWELDLNTGALDWSEETYRILGQDPARFTPSREAFFSCLHEMDRDRVKQAVDSAVRDLRPYGVSHRIVRPDGTERIVQEQAEIISESSGKAVRLIGTVQDITEQRRLEDQLRQAQKLEAIGLLAGGVAHDFNNLLTIMRGQTELTLAYEKLSPDGQDWLRQVVGAADRASNLTRQLLTFSRKHPMQMASLDLNAVVANLVRLLGRLIREDITLSIQSATVLPPIDADQGMLEQVLMNLAINARDAMPLGGELTIRTEVRLVDPVYQRSQPQARLGEYVCLTVHDNGAGISAENLPRIFEPFFTTKDVARGSGLGLATVHGIVQQHHGWIEVESRPEDGTTFRVFFPAKPSGDQSKLTAQAAMGAPGGSERILVVEDQDDLRRFVRLVLEKLNYRLATASSGADALRVWSEHQGAFDLLLTDAVMPGKMSGWELADRLKAERAGLKVIVMSGYDPHQAERTPDSENGIQFLPKPFSPQALAEAIRNSLDTL